MAEREPAIPHASSTRLTVKPWHLQSCTNANCSRYQILVRCEGEFKCQLCGSMPGEVPSGGVGS